MAARARSFEEIGQTRPLRGEGARASTIATLARRVRDRQAPLRGARRLSRPRGLREEHDHRRRARWDGRESSSYPLPTARCRRNPRSTSCSRVRSACRTSVVFLNKGRHGRRRGAPRARRGGGPRPASPSTSFPGDDIPFVTGSALQGARRATRLTRRRSSSSPSTSTATSRSRERDPRQGLS